MAVDSCEVVAEPAAAPVAADRRGVRRRGDRGAASIEMTGILMVAVLIVGALIVSAAPGGPLSSSVEALYCRAFSFLGVTCDSSIGAQDDDGTHDAPDQACVANSGLLYG